MMTVQELFAHAARCQVRAHFCKDLSVRTTLERLADDYWELANGLLVEVEETDDDAIVLRFD